MLSYDAILTSLTFIISFVAALLLLVLNFFLYLLTGPRVGLPDAAVRADPLWSRVKKLLIKRHMLTPRPQQCICILC